MFYHEEILNLAKKHQFAVLVSQMQTIPSLSNVGIKHNLHVFRLGGISAKANRINAYFTVKMRVFSVISRSRYEHLQQIRHKLQYRLSSTDIEEKIEIPRRIPRGSTDILRALESTIQRDLTAAHYKYHDDPYLIPMSNLGKRTFALAQESGRKAAHWVRQQNPELFQHREADPPIKSFFPKMVYDEKSDVTEDDLKTLVAEARVSDAALAYKLCKDKGLAVSPGTQQAMLELLCYYNGEDTLSEEFIEERWFRQSSKGREKVRKTWKDGSTAEEIFISFESPTGEAYSALIQGMAKYYQVDRAWELFQEAQQKGLPLSVDTYNSIISVASFLKESYEMRWTLVAEIMIQMEKAQIKPNLRTLNAVLETLSTIGGSNLTKQQVLRTLAEFKRLGIEPAFSSWYYVLITFCKERGPRSGVLNEIMLQIENKEHTIQDTVDTFFFVTAMDVCRNHLRDKELARRLHNLLHFGNNYNLIGDSYKESIYYRHYFILLCETEPLHEFMENVYYKLVPHIYVPEPSVMEEILKAVDLNNAIEYLPKIWSDMVVFDHTTREKLLNLLLSIMINNQPEATSDLISKFADISWGIYNKIEGQSENKITKLAFTGELLGSIMIVLLRSDDFEKACVVMGKLEKGHHTILGLPKFEALSLFLDNCIKEKIPSKAIECIQYCADNGFHEAEEMAVKLNKALTLDETHLNQLRKVVGSFALEQSLKQEEIGGG